ncbi:MAG: hypothetical protein ACOYI9_13755 [Candidatus Hydrogenedentales bacterium]|jgi:predicted transposase YdaD
MAKIAAFTKEERDAYEQSVKTLRDNTNIIDYAHEEGREKGRAEGREEGRVEGRVEGRAEGRAEGREEGKEELAREIVFNMLKKGMGFTEIAELTTLTVQQIENISKWQK